MIVDGRSASLCLIPTNTTAQIGCTSTKDCSDQQNAVCQAAIQEGTTRSNRRSCCVPSGGSADTALECCDGPDAYDADTSSCKKIDAVSCGLEGETCCEQNGNTAIYPCVSTADKRFTCIEDASGAKSCQPCGATDQACCLNLPDGDTSNCDDPALSCSSADPNQAIAENMCTNPSCDRDGETCCDSNNDGEGDICYPDKYLLCVSDGDQRVCKRRENTQLPGETPPTEAPGENPNGGSESEAELSSPSECAAQNTCYGCIANNTTCGWCNGKCISFDPRKAHAEYEGCTYDPNNPKLMSGDTSKMAVFEFDCMMQPDQREARKKSDTPEENNPEPETPNSNNPNDQNSGDENNNATTTPGDDPACQCRTASQLGLNSRPNPAIWEECRNDQGFPNSTYRRAELNCS